MAKSFAEAAKLRLVYGIDGVIYWQGARDLVALFS